MREKQRKKLKWKREREEKIRRKEEIPRFEKERLVITRQSWNEMKKTRKKKIEKERRGKTEREREGRTRLSPASS